MLRAGVNATFNILQAGVVLGESVGYGMATMCLLLDMPRILANETHGIDAPAIPRMFRNNCTGTRDRVTAERPAKVRTSLALAALGQSGVGALTVSHMALIADAARANGREPHFTILGAWEDNERYPISFDYPVDECFLLQQGAAAGLELPQGTA